LRHSVTKPQTEIKWQRDAAHKNLICPESKAEQAKCHSFPVIFSFFLSFDPGF
jgi:hypothetical protein